MKGRWFQHLFLFAIGCGVAAAIATAFNAPIAGLVFAHEVVLRHYSTQAFAPVTVAAATGYVVANVIFDRPPLFLIAFEGVGSGHEFVLFGLLGLLAAGLAIGFMHLTLAAGAHIGRSRLPAALRPALAGLALGLVALALPDVLGVGTVTLRFATIEGAFTLPELVLLIAAKIAVTALCIGGGFSGGVFSPALLIGSLVGALAWSAVDAFTPLATSGVAVYAIAGMMAFASAVIGAPLSCILIVFELTRNYDVTIAAMVAVVFSNLAAHRLFGRSLFDVQLARRGVDLSLGRDRARLQAMPVRDCATDSFPRAVTTDSPAIARARIDQAGWRQAFVTDPQGRFAGLYAPRRETGGTVAADVESAPLVFDETTSVIDAMGRMRDFVGDAVPVVERETGRLLGAVTEAAVVAAYLDVSETLRREENAAL